MSADPQFGSESTSPIPLEERQPALPEPEQTVIATPAAMVAAQSRPQQKPRFDGPKPGKGKPNPRDEPAGDVADLARIKSSVQSTRDMVAGLSNKVDDLAAAITVLIAKPKKGQDPADETLRAIQEFVVWSKAQETERKANDRKVMEACMEAARTVRADREAVRQQLNKLSLTPDGRKQLKQIAKAQVVKKPPLSAGERWAIVAMVTGVAMMLAVVVVGWMH